MNNNYLAMEKKLNYLHSREMKMRYKQMRKPVELAPRSQTA